MVTRALLFNGDKAERRNLRTAEVAIIVLKPPVFLQTGFRTGGTWLWSRFRELPDGIGVL
ncbi:MAG: hypothetical protein WDO73_32250 [Ignavibacteriota bacterium]